MALMDDDVAQAAGLLLEALAHAETFHDLPVQSASLAGLGWTELLSGRLADAEGRFLDSIGIAADIADPAGVGDCLRGLAGVDAERGRPAEAARLLATADALVDPAKAPLDPPDVRLRSRVVTSIERQLGTYDPQRRPDRAISIDEAVALAKASRGQSPAGASSP